MSFEDEMNAVKNAETTGNYISKACVELVTIKGYKMSPTDAKFTGCPFIEFTFETANAAKEINTTRLYRVRDGDTADTREFKNKRLKELLENAGADFTLKGEQVIKSAVTRKVQALFKEVEYIGYDKNNNNKPEVRTKIEYSFSGKADGTINGNQSYLFSALRDSDRNKFEGELAKWMRDFPAGAAPQQSNAAPVEAPSNDDDDLPF